MLLDGHFVLEHGARCGGGLFFNFNGTAGILRRAMIEDAGGWQHDTLTEDSDLSYRAQLKGWRFVYLPGVECPSELPVEMHGFQVQQSRWAKGLTQVAMKLLPAILQVEVPRRVKLEAFFHLTPNISYPLMIVMSRADAAGDDRAVLHGLDADAVSRSAADRRVVLVDLGCFTWWRSGSCIRRHWKRDDFLSAGADGGGGRVDDHQYARRAGGAVRRADGVCANAEVRHRRRHGEHRGRTEVPSPERLAAVCGAVHGHLFPRHGGVRGRHLNFFAVPFLLLFVGGYYWAGFATL